MVEPGSLLHPSFVALDRLSRSILDGLTIGIEQLSAAEKAALRGKAMRSPDLEGLAVLLATWQLRSQQGVDVLAIVGEDSDRLRFFWRSVDDVADVLSPVLGSAGKVDKNVLGRRLASAARELGLRLLGVVLRAQDVQILLGRLKDKLNLGGNKAWPMW